jgi:xylulokinase
VSLWLGLDLGSSAAKAVVADDTGALHWRAAEAYPETAVAERDGREPDALLRAVRALVARCVLKDALAGVGVVGYMPALVCVDATGRPVRPIIDWRDPRGADDADELARDLGDPRPLVGGALPWAAAYVPARLLWLARHEPDTVRRTRWVLQPKDYVGLRLTGSPVSDAWSSRGLCHMRTGAPVSEILSRVGWSESVVPPIAPAWAPRGRITEPGAELSGLPVGLPVAVGWADGLAAMLAAGVFVAPTAFITTGTADVIGISLTHEPEQAGPLLDIPRPCAPRPVLFGPTQAGGGSIAWLARLLGRSPEECVRLAGTATSDAAAVDGPVFVPYIAGERAPVWRGDVRGVMLGLDAEHGPAAIARATLLGVGYSARHVLETALGLVGQSAERVRVAGVAATNPVWRAIRLETLGRSIELVSEPQVTGLGAAMLGACAAGGDIREIAIRMSTPVETYAPSTAQVEHAKAGYARYVRATQISLGWR